MVEYGFAIKDNQYDFVRRKNLTVDRFYPGRAVDGKVDELFADKLMALNLKPQLQADLKQVALHRDVLKLLRCYAAAKYEATHSGEETPWHTIEQEAVEAYCAWIEREQSKYPTSLAEDEELLKKVEDNKDAYYWMY